MNVTEQWLPSASDQEDEQQVRVRKVEADWDDRLRRFGALEEREAVVRSIRNLSNQISRRNDGDPMSEFLKKLALFFEAGGHRKP